MQQLVLIRGLPGSGKTTLAKEVMADFPHFAHFEADMFFERNGGFVPEDVPASHRWCQNAVYNALHKGNSVVVSNTFCQRWEMDAYKEMAEEFGIDPIIVVADGNFESSRKVPPHTLERMHGKWED